MKFFFVTYCFASPGSEALIGVYKRGLRLALELCERNHEVIFFCSGREAYRDELVEKAESVVAYIDFPFSEKTFREADEQREAIRQQVRDLAPDIVVVGEVPLAGAMLEVTVCAVEMGIPVVFLDNAYHPGLTNRFCKYHAPMADGVILTGLSSSYSMRQRSYLCQVPPYIDLPAEGAAEPLVNAGIEGRRLMTVLAYDNKVEQVGLSLFERLADPYLEAVFLSRDLEHCRQQVERLPNPLKAKIRVLPPPSDIDLFSLLRHSRLAVSKYGFMQVSECLALHTPVIAVYRNRHNWLRFMPRVVRRFAHQTSAWEADMATVIAARRLLQVSQEAMGAVHDGQLDATAQAADFLEALPRNPRLDTLQQCCRLGFTPGRLIKALSSWHGQPVEEVFLLRAMRLRKLQSYWLYLIICGYLIDGKKQCIHLWGHRYRSFRTAHRDRLDTMMEGSMRRVLYYSWWHRRMIELDLGQGMLPPVELK